MEFLLPLAGQFFASMCPGRCRTGHLEEIGDEYGKLFINILLQMALWSLKKLQRQKSTTRRVVFLRSQSQLVVSFQSPGV